MRIRACCPASVPAARWFSPARAEEQAVLADTFNYVRVAFGSYGGVEAPSHSDGGGHASGPVGRGSDRPACAARGAHLGRSGRLGPHRGRCSVGRRSRVPVLLGPAHESGTPGAWRLRDRRLLPDRAGGHEGPVDRDYGPPGTTGTGAVISGVRRSDGDTFSAPDDPDTQGYFGPNFRYDADPIPEPALVQLPFMLGLGGVGVWWMRRRPGRSG